MIEVALQPVPSQIVRIVLDNQNVQLKVYDKGGRIYIDVNSDGSDIVTAALVFNGNPVRCCAYIPFRGNFVFIDVQGSENPEYIGLGSRYKLIYLTAAENEFI